MIDFFTSSVDGAQVSVGTSASKVLMNLVWRMGLMVQGSLCLLKLRTRDFGSREFAREAVPHGGPANDARRAGLRVALESN